MSHGHLLVVFVRVQHVLFDRQISLIFACLTVFLDLHFLYFTKVDVRITLILYQVFGLFVIYEKQDVLVAHPRHLHQLAQNTKLSFIEGVSP